MTVCGIKHADGVCVMGKCPYIKKCCPAVWDKSGEPMTNEEWLRSATTEQLAEEISHLVFGGDFKKHISKMGYINMHSFKTEIVEWLKQPHTKGEAK